MATVSLIRMGSQAAPRGKPRATPSTRPCVAPVGAAGLPRRILSAFLAAGLFLGAPFIFADSAAPAAAHFAPLAASDLVAALPPPPAAGSLAAQADLETDLQVQASRTADQVAWAKLVADFDPWVLFGHGDLLGPGFTKTDLPHLARLLADFRSDASPVYKAAKQAFGRPRPFSVDPRVQPCVWKPVDASYPSGHSFSAYTCAAILAEVFPEKRAELFERARSIAWARVISGVHFPTDLEGGRRLAQAVIAAELGNPAFQAALEECRREASAGAATTASR
jgi:acid phosphatase (class A)